MTIDLVINLWNSKINDQDMFTIGADDVANTDMSFKSANVTYRNKFTKDTQKINFFLNKDSKNIHAIALLYKRSNSFPEFVLDTKTPTIIINEKLQEIIKTNLVDFIVYTRKEPYDNCDIFTSLYDDYANKEYILREFDNQKEPTIDRTLNRCAFGKDTFIPEKFKLGLATPGKENDCTGINFFIENHFTENINFDAEDADACVVADAYENISDDTIEKEIIKETEAASINKCSDLNLGSNDGNIADEIDRTNRRKRRLKYHEDVNEWESTDHFQ